MAIHQLILSPAAKSDLQDIYLYGLRQWGQAQANAYLERLKKLLWSLTQQPLMGTERSELLPEMRSLPSESHILFYRAKAAHVEIIRVLHSRQDPQRHLK